MLPDAVNRKAHKARYVWCAEDEKYGLQAVYATKRSAWKDWMVSNAPQQWPSGYGGTIIKRRVYE